MADMLRGGVKMGVRHDAARPWVWSLAAVGLHEESRDAISREAVPPKAAYAGLPSTCRTYSCPPLRSVWLGARWWMGSAVLAAGSAPRVLMSMPAGTRHHVHFGSFFREFGLPAGSRQVHS